MMKTTVDPEAWLATRVRSLTARCDVLYHGTRYAGAILAAGTLLPARVGDAAVCFTRSPNEAAYWATLPRDDDEKRGAIFVFDRWVLRTRYRICLHKDAPDRDEFEERVWNRTIALDGALLGFVREPFVGRSCHRALRDGRTEDNAGHDSCIV